MTTDRAPLPPLAIPVKWGHREAPGSYLTRLLATNDIPMGDAMRYVNKLCQHAAEPTAHATHLRDVIPVELGHRSPDLATLIRSRAQPLGSAPYPSPRYGCRLCSAGEVIRQVAHDSENLCLKHAGQMVWIGPGTVPDSQRILPFDRHIARAERLHRRYSAARRFNPDLTARTWEMTRDNARLSGWAHVDPVLSKLHQYDRPSWQVDARLALYPSTVALAQLLTDQRHLSIWLNPALSNRELRTLFTTALLDTGQYPCGIRDLVERMLVHLRPLRQRAATWDHNPTWRTAPWLWEQDLSTVDISDWGPAGPSSADPIDTRRCIDIAMYDMLPRNPLAIDEWDWQANGCASPWTAPPTLDAWYVCQTCHNRYQAPIRRRANGAACQICNDQQIVPGVNDLASRRPDIAAQWDPTPGVNSRTPEQVTPRSRRTMGWLCPRCGHRWRTSVVSRSNADDCKQCALLTRQDAQEPRAILRPGVNDLATLYPNLAAQWDPTPGVNAQKPQQLTAQSNRRIGWKCPTCTARWTAPVYGRVAGGGCPVCAGQRTLAGHNDLATHRPDLAQEWDDTPGANTKRPQQVSLRSNYEAAWVCRSCGARWDAKVFSRSLGRGCPYCVGVRVWPGHNDLASQRPDLAAEWATAPGKNTRTPNKVSLYSNYRATWCCQTCGQEWKSQVCARSRTRGSGCPTCRRKERGTRAEDTVMRATSSWPIEP